MGKNYVENSLKRFLKRKVKITLGFVVAFMISGTIGFAEELINNDNYIIKLENDKISITAKLWNKEQEIDIDKNLFITPVYQQSESEIYIKNVNNAFNILKNIIKNENNPLNLDGTTYEEGLKLAEQENVKTEIGEDITKPSKEINGSIYVNNSEIKTQLFLSNDDNLKNEYENITLINKGTIKNDDKGTQSHGQYLRGKENLNIYNFGRISVKTANGTFAESAGQLIIGKNSTIYNYGVIEASYGQYGRMSSGNFLNTNIYNYGVLLGRTGQYLHKTYFTETKDDIGFALNNGVIVSIEGQILQAENSKMINNGLIVSKNDGQLIQPVTNDKGTINSKVYNYGLIETFGSAGQTIRGTNGVVRNSTAYNMGILNNNVGRSITNEKSYSMGGQNVYDDGNIVNYGIIKDIGQGGQILYSSKEDTTKKMTSINNGLIYTGDYGIRISYDSEKVNNFNAEAVNNGVVIVNGEHAFSDDNGQEKNIKDKQITANNGIALKRTEKGLELHSQVFSNGESVNNNTYNLTTNKTITEIENDSSITVANQKNNIFVNNLDKDSNITLTVDKDTLDSKHITTVVGEKSEVKTTIKAQDDLTLNDSTIIGYFEKEGTLLEVNGDLTLKGNSVISAITGNEYTGYTGNKVENVVAVSLKDEGILTLEGNSNVLGAIKGNGVTVLKDFQGTRDYNDEIKELDIKTTVEKGTDATLNSLTTTHGVVISGHETSKENTKIIFGNNIDINGSLKFTEISEEMLGADITLGDGQISSDKTINIDSISLGNGEDILTIQNALGKVGTIDGRDGDDVLNLKNLNGNHDTFDYALKNIETLDLNNQTWKIGENASIEFGNSGTITKAPDKITVQNGTLMGEMKFDIDENGNSAEFSNDNIDDVLGKIDFSTEKGKEGYLQLGISENSKLQAGAEYDMNITDETKQNLENMKDNITVSGIFGKGTGKNEIRVKTAQEMGINGRYSELYNQMLENADKEEVRDVLNNTDFKEIASLINSKGAMADTLATSGYKITRDISNSFISSVNEWNKKANKGEWLANAKYINSDVEYDGANSVKGYDSDITSMVGMIEYGVSDNTSYGVALGGGDTEVDVNGAGTLEGDNYYIGAYAKHSVNGFDLVGNLGYTISDLEVDGNGNADSSAITLAGYVKRDIKLSETVKVEPNLAFTYDYIMQDDAEGNGVKVENKDIHVFEATAGMNIIKEFAFNNGNLELKAGIKYSMADINRNEETIMVNVLNTGNTTLGNPEVDKTRGTAHIGFDYEHETGFGVNGKYETMWSDSGDDSRVTAGISYRF